MELVVALDIVNKILMIVSAARTPAFSALVLSTSSSSQSTGAEPCILSTSSLETIVYAWDASPSADTDASLTAIIHPSSKACIIRGMFVIC